MVNLNRSEPYDPAEGLDTPENIADYLDAALEEQNDQVLLMALRNSVAAIGGMTELAQRTGLSRETLYRTLSEKGNPRLSTLRAILKAFGVNLAVRPAQAA
jgi:probable addiction module antidote protein